MSARPHMRGGVDGLAFRRIGLLAVLVCSPQMEGRHLFLLAVLKTAKAASILWATSSLQTTRCAGSNSQAVLARLCPDASSGYVALTTDCRPPLPPAMEGRRRQLHLTGVQSRMC